MPAHPRAHNTSFDLFEWLNANEGIVDAALSALTIAIALALFAPVAGPALWWSLAMIAAAAFVRTHTEVAALVIAALALAHFAAGLSLIFGDIATVLALYMCVVRARAFARRIAMLAAFSGASLVVAFTIVERGASYGWTEFAAYTSAATSMGAASILIIAVWALGRYQRVKVTQLQLARQQALHAERERDQLAQLAVAAERARIARDMHDVVAHSLTVIIAQADGGRYVATAAPEKIPDILATISSTGRDALTDMRSMLGVLRGHQGPDRSPQPGIRNLPELCDSFEASGLHIERDFSTDARPQSAAVDLTLLRVIQEALTNVLKHAGVTARARVTLYRAAGQWHARIHNTAPASNSATASIPSTGLGLKGMAERVGAVGGSMSASRQPDGGFLVNVTIDDTVRTRAPNPLLNTSREVATTPALEKGSP